MLKNMKRSQEYWKKSLGKIYHFFAFNTPHFTNNVGVKLKSLTNLWLQKIVGFSSIIEKEIFLIRNQICGHMLPIGLAGRDECRDRAYME